MRSGIALLALTLFGTGAVGCGDSKLPAAPDASATDGGTKGDGAAGSSTDGGGGSAGAKSDGGGGTDGGAAGAGGTDGGGATLDGSLDGIVDGAHDVAASG
jgi:hypothetical protein